MGRIMYGGGGKSKNGEREIVEKERGREKERELGRERDRKRGRERERERDMERERERGGERGTGRGREGGGGGGREGGRERKSKVQFSLVSIGHQNSRMLFHEASLC